MECFGIIFIFFCIFCFIMAIRTITSKKGTLRSAHDKVLELRQKGIDAHICPKCQGKGVFGTWDRECKVCGGIGYTYRNPPVSGH